MIMDPAVCWATYRRALTADAVVSAPARCVSILILDHCCVSSSIYTQHWIETMSMKEQSLSASLSDGKTACSLYYNKQEFLIDAGRTMSSLWKGLRVLDWKSALIVYYYKTEAYQINGGSSWLHLYLWWGVRGPV